MPGLKEVPKMKAFVIDLSKCVGCYCCQIGCKDEHVGNDWTPYAKPQPDTGQFWLQIKETERGNIPQVLISYVPVLCQHCEDAPCIPACTPGAIYRRADGLVIIDPTKCTGCQKCLNADACPYGVIYFNKDLNLAQKCTGCAHLLDQYGWKVPRCVDNCPTNALQFGEESALASQIAGAEKLHPEFGLKPRAHYLNLPKKFIAGCVYDPTKKEVIEGAACTLTGEGSTLTQKTDAWGDFWFDGLKVGTYSLKIEAAGKTKTIPNISTAKDVGLGDIALS
jgi:Fe-S-cluster-containing dehydrogenase component